MLVCTDDIMVSGRVASPWTRLPPFQYSLQAPSTVSVTRVEITRLIRQDLIQLDTRRTWIDPVQELGTKMAFYKEHLLQLSGDGFVIRPSYMDTSFVSQFAMCYWSDSHILTSARD